MDRTEEKGTLETQAFVEYKLKDSESRENEENVEMENEEDEVANEKKQIIDAIGSKTTVGTIFATKYV
jgi:hypothetical protein